MLSLAKTRRRVLDLASGSQPMRVCHMDAAQTDFQPMLFTSAAVPERDRVAMWRDFFGPSVFGVEIEPASDVSFYASSLVRRLPGLVLASSANSPARFSRTAPLAARGSDDIELFLNSKGGAAWQAGREIVLQGNEAYLMRAGEAGGFASATTRSHCLHLRVPRADLSPMVPGLDKMMMQPIPANAGALQYMASYIRFALNDQALADPETARLAANHLRDLFMLTLGATRDAAFIAERRGLRAARLQAIKSFIADNLGQPWLSVGPVAMRHGVTPRSVQRMFEEEGTTLSEYILERRLDFACRLLADPIHARRTVLSVALEAGFGDLSYFNRCFRRRFGAPPSWLRPAPMGGRRN